MATVNDVTGQRIKTPVASQAYLNNYDAIFGTKETKEIKKSTETI